MSEEPDIPFPDLPSFEEGAQPFGIQDSVFICSRAYAKTEDAFEAIKKAALEIGYEEKNYDDKDTAAKDYIYLSLDTAAAECGSCNEVISRTGVQCHGHKCECCGEVTYLEYVPGGAIRFVFLDKHERIGEPLTFQIHDYRTFDDKPNELVLLPQPILGEYKTPSGQYVRHGLFDVTDPAEAQAIMDEAETRKLFRRENLFCRETDSYQDVIVLIDPEPHMITPQSVFNTHDIWGQYRNFKEIDVFRGEKFDKWFGKTLPVPDSLSVSRKYIGRDKHSLGEPNIHATILRAAGQGSDCGYYHQDGSIAFSGVVLDRMTAFVHHFVDVDIEKWNAFLETAPKDGPGFIMTLAKWSSAMSDGSLKNVVNKSNIFNAINGMHKMMTGKSMTEDEIESMIQGAQTQEADDFAESILDTLEDKQRRKSQGERKWGDDLTGPDHDLN